MLFKSEAYLISGLDDAPVIENGVLMCPILLYYCLFLLALLVLLCIFGCSTVEPIKHLQLLYLLDVFTPLTLYNNLFFF